MKTHNPSPADTRQTNDLFPVSANYPTGEQMNQQILTPRMQSTLNRAFSNCAFSGRQGR